MTVASRKVSGLDTHEADCSPKEMPVRDATECLVGCNEGESLSYSVLLGHGVMVAQRALNSLALVRFQMPLPSFKDTNSNFYNFFGIKEKMYPV